MARQIGRGKNPTWASEMNDAVGAISNSQLWTVAFSGIAALLGALAPIIIARYQTRQAAESAKKEIEVAAIKAREEAKQQARKDAVAEWQTLYGERQREVVELKSTVGSMQLQNTTSSDSSTSSHSSTRIAKTSARCLRLSTTPCAAR
jgi:hypothetical protein